MSAPTIEEQIEAVATECFAAQCYAEAVRDMHPAAPDETLAEAYRKATALRAAEETLKRMQWQPIESHLEAMARAHDAALGNPSWQEGFDKYATQSPERNKWPEWRQKRIDAMRAAIAAIPTQDAET